MGGGLLIAGISFGGVASFIFADLIVLPILDIYRKYYGGGVALYILLFAAALVVQFRRTGGPAMLRMMNASPKGGRV